MSVEGLLGSTDEYLRLEEEVSVQYGAEEEEEHIGKDQIRDTYGVKQEVESGQTYDEDTQDQELKRETRGGEKDPMEDEDVDLLSRQIDEIASIMKQSVVESAIGMKYNVLRRCGDHMGAVRDELGKKLDAAGQQIESLMATDVRQKSEIMKLTASLERMSDLLAARTERMRLMFGVGQKVFMQWKSFGEQKHEQRIRDRMLDKHYQSHLQRGILTKWRAWTDAQRRKRNEEVIQNRIETTVSRMMTDYQTQVSSMKRTIQQQQQVIESYERQKEILESNLKKAFMRGVCALNMEAMQVLKEGRLGPKDQSPLVPGFEDDGVVGGEYGESVEKDGGSLGMGVGEEEVDDDSLTPTEPRAVVPQPFAATEKDPRRVRPTRGIPKQKTVGDKPKKIVRHHHPRK
eukprot:TRINITY_DN729_c0_g1_i1.p1 TRINITY_DN729_c0_g1~~TRINITY_DN729_c0_g1_i1.p1  ORF type:complete len:402 (-),score=124.44 TRINITY_DN729_c0_g1_i1:834-2039(-)